VIAGRGRHLLLGVAALLVAEAWPTATVADARFSADTGVRQGSQNVDVETIGEAIIGRPIEMVFRATNPAQDANQGSITVSIPANVNVEIVGASAPNPKLFRPGENMYNFSAGRQAAISTPAAELFVGSWPAGQRHELRLRLTSQAPYTLLARASFRRGNGSFVHLPPNGPPDQQGAPTRRQDVTPRPVNPPTPTPAPPTPTRPPPTNTPPPPTPTAAPPDKPAAGKPTPPPPAAPTPTTAQAAVPPPSAIGPVGAPAVTPTPPPPTPGSASTSSRGGPSIPYLLAGFGIIAVGVAIGLIALLLFLRRRPGGPPARPVGWHGPGGPYPGPGVAPGGTARMPAAAGGPYDAPFGGPPPGAPPWGPPSSDRRGAPPAWGGRPGANDQPGAPPWERPPTPAEPRLPHDGQPDRESPRPPAPVGGVAGAGEPPTVGTPPVGGRGVDDATGRPTSIEGLGGTATPQSDRYIDRTLVGRGGMGSVYRAYDSRLRRWVALKIMHADLGLRPGFVDRFVREAQVAAMLEHPNIVTVYDIELLGDSIQMVMSWVEGQDLQHLLEHEGALAPERASLLLNQIAAALDHAHLRERPVLHRDIKPSNIMVGPNDRVILTDFGIARLMGDVSLTQTGQMVGTPAFMAPEVVQGEDADARADIYALGVVLFQMLTGEAPFRAQTPLALLHAHVNTPPPSPRTAVPGLPPSVDQVMARALAKDPRQRFQTAGAMARAFRSALGLL
jgi:hypothetical protein